jgi:hypothetical protein
MASPAPPAPGLGNSNEERNRQMTRARAPRPTTQATQSRGIASRILRALFASPCAKGTGALSVLALVVVAALAPSASATKYVDNFFGNPTSSTGTTGGLFNTPRGVAVNDTTGAIYVVDGANNRIQQFDAANSFVRAWGTDVVITGRPNDVSTSAFEICDTQHPTTPNAADDCKAGVTSGTGTGGQLNNPQGIAVNQATGNVYVTEGGRFRVQEFTASGQFVRTWGRDVVTTGSPNNVSTTAFEVCDTTAGNTEAHCKTGVSSNTGGAFGATFVGYPAVAPAGAPNAGNVVVADPANSRVQEFTSSGAFVRAFGFDVVSPGGAGEQVGAPVDEQQRITLADAFGFGTTPTAGTFTLTFDGQTTATPIAYDASFSAIREALEGLSNIAPGDISVNGNPGGPWTVTFTGAHAGTNVPEMAGNGSGLTTPFGPSTGAVGIGTPQPGGPGPAFEVCTVISQCKVGIAGAASGQFAANEPKRVAADAAGSIYTVEINANLRVQKFTGAGLSASPFASADLAGGFPSGSGSQSPTDIAIDPSTGRVFVARSYTISQSSFFSACAAAAGGERRILEFDAAGVLRDTHMACARVATGGAVNNQGLAVRFSTGRVYTSASLALGEDAQRVYVLDADGITPAVATIGAPVNVTADSAQLTATVNPNSVDNTFAPTRWSLQYSPNGVSWSTAATGTINAANTTPVAVSAAAVGLRPNTQYRVRVMTQKPFANPEVPSAELTFLTDAVRPEIRSTAVQDVGMTTARLGARINAHSTPTSYRIEWGEGAFTNITPIPDATAGSGADFVHVSQVLSNLEPATPYQFRFIATSVSEGPTTGPTKTFTTAAQPISAANRAYELVSPADKIGGQGVGAWYKGVGSHGTTGMAARDGERFAVQSFYGGVLIDGAYSYGGDYTLAERTPTGWVNKPAFNRAGGHGQVEFARIPFLATASDDFSLTSWATNNNTMRLFPEMENWTNTSVNTEMLRDWTGRWEILAPTENAKQTGAVVAADGGHSLFFGAIRGIGGPGDPSSPAWPDLTAGGNVYLDDVSAGLSDSFPGDGIRSLVNVCTGSGADRTQIPSVTGAKQGAQACPDALPGRDARLIDSRGAGLNPSSADVSYSNQAVSRDGARVFFLSPDANVPVNGDPCSGSGATTACPPQLYVRQRNADGGVTTRWISRSTVADQDANLMAPVTFEGASTDGDKVYFSTTAPLTADDPNGAAPVPGGVTTGVPSADSRDLYLYDLPDAPGADPGAGTLTRVSGGPEGAADPNLAPGGLRFTSKDGLRGYFVTEAVLTGTPLPGNGTITTPSTGTSGANLYLYDAHRSQPERWTFIARLPTHTPLGDCASAGRTVTDDALQDDGAGTGGGTTTGQGRKCFWGISDGAFVGFWTDGRLVADDPDSATGDVYAYDADADALDRLTGVQGGLGGSYECVSDGPAATTRCYGDPGLGNSNYHMAKLQSAIDPEQPGDRLAFFESGSRLTADDHNDVYDVYQWRNGELSLVSTGAEDADHALYRGNDRTGRNVYISTRDQLTWQDHDAVLDIYTARVDGGIPQPLEPSACGVLSDACQSSGSGTPVSTAGETARPTPAPDDGADDPRGAVSFGALTARQRTSLARGRTVSLRVRVNQAGRIRVRGRSRIGAKARTVVSATANTARAGTLKIPIRLSSPARRALDEPRDTLRMSLSVRFSKALETATRSFRLRAVAPAKRRATSAKWGGAR